MSLPIEIGGALTTIPGVYSTFKVAGSLPAPAPAGRSILIFGEAEEGAPGSELDLRAMRFSDFQSVRDYYYNGPIVDAARMIFSGQPGNTFSGAVQALYVYKTNASSRASKEVSSPANFGELVAARYGERGNQIKSQIQTGQSESKPTKTYSYLPSPGARDFRVSVNGEVSSGLTVAAEGLASDFVVALTGIPGLSVTGGEARTTITSGPMDVDTTVSGDQLTLSRASGAATFDTSSIKAGDVCWIDTGLPVSGVSSENAGSYEVVSVTATSLVLKQLKANESNASALAALLGVSVAAADLKINNSVTLTVTATTAAGTAASLEVLEDSADKAGLGSLVRSSDFSKMLNSATASVATISASVPSAGKLLVSLSGGSWAFTPKAGDLVQIQRTSLLAGATLKNVGYLVVESASSQTLTLSHLFAGMTTEAVASANVNGADGTLWASATSVSASVAARRIDSSAERKVKVDASRSSDGAAVPQTLIGGNVALELGYYQVGATACTATIDQTRTLTITPTGAGSVISVKLLKYKTLQALADYLGSLTGVTARVPDNRYKSLSPAVLDMATLNILSGHSTSALNGRIKKDYYDWKKFFQDNFSLLAFKEGAIVLKNDLPAAEAAAGYLSGAEIGATSMADIQSGLDEALKIDVRMVVPLFSRDAQYDIDDSNTDANSSYTIDAINAAVKAHVSTASSSLFKKERYGYVSFDGAFSDALQKVGELAYERCKMGFQRHRATNANGENVKFLPWMAMCAVAAGRAQSASGVSMLRKPFLLNSAEHVGQASLYTDTLNQDFNPDDRGQLETAISAGLMVMREVSGFGVRMESPDLTSRSRDSDPEGWVWERESVLAVCDDFVDAARRVLENFIGNRTSDTPLAVIQTAIENVIRAFVRSGALLSGSVTKIVSLGNAYRAEVKITPAEALEAITLDVLAEREAA